MVNKSSHWTHENGIIAYCYTLVFYLLYKYIMKTIQQFHMFIIQNNRPSMK
jgi:hypothetical protein